MKSPSCRSERIALAKASPCTALISSLVSKLHGSIFDLTAARLFAAGEVEEFAAEFAAGFAGAFVLDPVSFELHEAKNSRQRTMTLSLRFINWTPVDFPYCGAACGQLPCWPPAGRGKPDFGRFVSLCTGLSRPSQPTGSDPSRPRDKQQRRC